MLFHSRVFHCAKDTAYADEYEDAFASDAETGRAAIADGVSSAIFSALWGRILTEAIVRQPPELNDAGAFSRWLAECRAAWVAKIDFPNLPYHQKAKLRQAGGAFCTLCWLSLHEEPAAEGEHRRFHADAYALGDSCLFHVRDGAVLKAFPMQASAEFDIDPASLCSIASDRDQSLEFGSLKLECAEGDLLVLCTDAVAKWMFTVLEAGERVPWESYAWLDEQDWIGQIDALRDQKRMRRDDSTLLLLSVGRALKAPGDGSVAASLAGDSAPAVSEEPTPVSASPSERNTAAAVGDCAAESAPVFVDATLPIEVTAPVDATAEGPNGALEEPPACNLSAGGGVATCSEPACKAGTDLDSLLQENPLGA